MERQPCTLVFLLHPLAASSCERMVGAAAPLETAEFTGWCRVGDFHSHCVCIYVIYTTSQMIDLLLSYTCI